jgi:hypothetical protein
VRLVTACVREAAASVSAIWASLPAASRLTHARRPPLHSLNWRWLLTTTEGFVAFIGERDEGFRQEAVVNSPERVVAWDARS